MTATSVHPSAFSLEACSLLVKLRDKRTDYKTGEQDLIKARKKLEEDLAEMGPGRSDAKMQKTCEYWECLRGIEKCRAEQKFLADTIDSVIDHGRQGSLVDDGKLAEIERSLRGEDLPLYQDLVKEIGAVDEDGPPIGTPENKPRKTKKAEPAAEPEADSDFEALAKDPERWSKPLSLIVQDEPLALLHKAGLRTIGNGYWFVRKDGSLSKLGLDRDLSDAIGMRLVAMANGGLNPPPEGMHIEQPKPGKGRKPKSSGK